MPFFATQNKPDSSDAYNAEYGPTGIGINTRTLGGDVWQYYGCFLNFYDPTVNFKPVGSHHCLVAQIAFAGSPLISGTNQLTPANSDKLAQRNLSIAWAENPGPATKVVPQTFDLKPTKPVTGTDLDRQQERPDDLLIEWGDTPPDSVCQIYWPAINAQDVIDLARKYYGTHSLSVVDANTIELKSVQGVSWVPIPPSAGENYAGLITVSLPSTIVDGQKFNIVLHRLSTHVKPIQRPPALVRVPKLTPAPVDVPSDSDLAPPTPAGPAPRRSTADYWKYEVGSFAVSIPVTKAENFVHYELDQLAIMKYRLSQTPSTDRWFPVLKRYVGVLSSRVDGLWRDAGSVTASAGGAPIEVHSPGCDDGGYGEPNEGYGGQTGGGRGYGREGGGQEYGGGPEYGVGGGQAGYGEGGDEQTEEYGREDIHHE